MSTIIRGIKNIFRNKFRNILIILILTLALSLALMMFNMDFSLNNITKSVKRKIGARFFVSISPEYMDKLLKEHDSLLKAYEDESSLIDEALADEILNIDSVESVSKLIRGSFTSEKLKSYEAEMRSRQGEGYEEAVEEKVTTPEGEEIDPTTQFILLGITDANMIREFQDGGYNLLEGDLFKRTDIEQNVALIGKRFAERNRLKLGSEFVINGEKIKVCGIYKFNIPKHFNKESEFFIAKTIYIPFKTAQRLTSRKGKMHDIAVTVDSLDNVQKTMNYINNKLISDERIKAHQEYTKYSVMLWSTNSIKRISKIGMISAFLVGVLIILSVMFISVRNRAKEIGILKAIGASNLNISSQFLIESLAICIIALILSIVIILAANKPVSDFIVDRGAPQLADDMMSKAFGTEKEEGEGYEMEIIETSVFIELASLKIIFSPQILIFAILLTFLLAAMGSIIPAYYISKLRPAEVLRFE